MWVIFHPRVEDKNIIHKLFHLLWAPAEIQSTWQESTDKGGGEAELQGK